MSNIFVVFISIGVSLSTAQWMPYLDPQTISPFTHPLPEELIVSKDASTKIPIILLLKPKRAKSLSADTNSEAIERHQSETEHTMTIDQWMGMPHINSDSMGSSKTHLTNQQMSSDYGMSEEPDQEASEGDEVTIKGRGGEQIKWPQTLKSKKNGMTAEQLASISHLFPNLAAMSASNADLPKMTNKDTGALFEDALKKFTSNLTDLEHSNNNNNNDEDNSERNTDEEENSSESSIETQSSGIVEPLTSTQTESNVNNKENTEERKSSYTVEQRDTNQRLSPQKSRPFINERNRIKIPVKSETNQQKSAPEVQTVIDQHSHKGWVPIKNKSHKPKRRPSKPVDQRPEAHVLRFPSEFISSSPSPIDGQYLYHNNEHNYYGMPEPLNSIASVEPPPHLFRPRHFPHTYIPYDTKQTISQLPYHKYTSYLTETDMSPTLMEMTADANKPQHMGPIKMGEEVPSALNGVDKHKDVIERKEQMIDNKHVINEKHMIIDEKHAVHGLGEDLLGQHLTCCDILHGQHNGPHHHVVHEEVIHKPDFDDDKMVANMGIHEPFHKHDEYPIQFGSNFGSPIHNSGLKFSSYLPQPIHHKKCQHQFHNSYPPTYWPPKVYRRPVYRPKFFYKPLLFG